MQPSSLQQHSIKKICCDCVRFCCVVFCFFFQFLFKLIVVFIFIDVQYFNFSMNFKKIYNVTGPRFNLKSCVLKETELLKFFIVELVKQKELSLKVKLFNFLEIRSVIRIKCKARIENLPHVCTH